MRAEKKNIIFAYSTPENKQFIEQLALKHNNKISCIVNKIIEGFRTGKKVSFQTIVPKYVQQADEWKKKHA